MNDMVIHAIKAALLGSPSAPPADFTASLVSLADEAVKRGQDHRAALEAAHGFKEQRDEARGALRMALRFLLRDEHVDEAAIRQLATQVNRALGEPPPREPLGV